MLYNHMITVGVKGLTLNGRYVGLLYMTDFNVHRMAGCLKHSVKNT